MHASTTPGAAAVRTAVGSVMDPELRRPIGELDMVHRADVYGTTAQVTVALTIVGCPAARHIEDEVRAAASGVIGVTDVELEMTVMTPEQRQALTEKLRAGRPARTPAFGPDTLTRIIAVTSGKGGVGKSSITANLAVALAARGRRVGLIDADVHGFSIPALLGLVDENGHAPNPTRIDDLMLPPVGYDVKTISIGMFLREGDNVVAWRGPMLHRTLQQFLTDVHFGDLDVLLIDMPPGTGDIAISMGQLVPHAEVLVVTTPQTAASDVAIRSGLVARQTGQRILGVVENMSAMVLPDGTTLDLFGEGGGHVVAEQLSTPDNPVPLMASIPLDPALRQGGDTGVPLVRSHPDNPTAAAIIALAAQLDSQGRNLVQRHLPIAVHNGRAG
ncbi:Mrp/NBP35 family ATP-binding protein [Microbacterium sp. YY-01]|uniref:Mrp/NBP35 family ATP-binding protein n=1 Tax=Microbacterium sp. YY-01 TaxID=3421634 RepID=UPI003D164BBD